MYEKEIEVRMKKLPEGLRKEVLDYIEFLLSKQGNVDINAKKFKFDWEGELSDIGDKINSVELQHKVEEWR